MSAKFLQALIVPGCLLVLASLFTARGSDLRTALTATGAILVFISTVSTRMDGR